MNIACYTLVNRHVATVWYVLLVNTRCLEFLVNCAPDTLGFRHASITTKIKHKVKGRALVSFLSVAVRVALLLSEIRTNATNGCVTCKEKKEAGHLFFMRPLVSVPASSERVLYVLYDFATTQDTKRSNRTNEHVPTLVC